MGQAHAISKVNGIISFDGTVVLNSSVATATAFDSFSNVEVAALTNTGDYAGTDGSLVTMQGFAFDPFAGAAISPLWTFDIGLVTYSFELTSITLVDRFAGGGNYFLSVAGSGMASITGFEDAAGTWSLTTQSGTGATTLSFSSTTSVPDSGATAALLGLGLIGLGAASRRFKK